MARIVRAFHGTTYSAAQAILAHQQSFRPSDRGDEWLGRGVYFYEENLIKAIERALQQVMMRASLGSFDSAAVIAVDVDLSDSLDLCSSLYHDALRNGAQALERAGQLPQQHGPILTTAGLPPAGPIQFAIADYPQPAQAAYAPYADKAVIDLLVAQRAATERPFTCVRSAFASGEQPYSNSQFFSDTHVQIAVIDLAIISAAELIHPVPPLNRLVPTV